MTEGQELPADARIRPFMALVGECNLVSASQYPSPQRAETPTPCAGLHRLPQWQDPCTSFLQPAAKPRPIFGQEQVGNSTKKPAVGAATPAKIQDSGQPGLLNQPATPPRVQKSKTVIKRLRSSSRSSSLNDEKVLFQTQLVRSQSTFKFLDNFIVQDKIGESRQSKVFRVRHRNSGQHFALKRSARRFSSKGHRDSYLRELSAVSSLPAHPNIVSYYRAWQQDKFVYIQMALCEGGSLAQQIQKVHKENARLQEQRIVEILSDLCQGLEFLHEHHILHLDIKPENIFLDAEDHCKIGDFGLAIGDTDKVWQDGDGAYLAPELLSLQSPTPAADIYSAGATIYECCTGERVPGDKKTIWPLGLGISDQLAGLVFQMLQPQLAARPSAAEVNHKVAQLYAEHPDWNAPMERVASLCPSSLQEMEAECGNDDGMATPTSTLRPHQSSICQSAFQPLAINVPSCSSKGQSVSGGHESCILAPAEAELTLDPMQPAVASTPPVSPLPSFGDRQDGREERVGSWGEARQEDWRVDDTAYCVRKQPPRDHWSRKALLFANENQPDTGDCGPQRTPEPTPAGERYGRCQEGAALPKFTVPRPFTAMRSPFAEASFQKWGNGLTSPTACGSTDGSSGTPPRSQRFNKSSDMDDLQSTVRCLNMC